FFYSFLILKLLRMIKLLHSVSITMICLLFATTVHGQDVEARLAELDIQLIKGNPPTANYLKAVTSGNYVYLSGHGPDKPEGGQVIGKLGADLTVEEGKAA